MPANYYLAIEGVIGVGKTTLARLLQPYWDAQLLLEVFEENPFLSDFYADRAQYAFQTQIFFLISRYRQQHHVVRRLLDKGHVISDYTFVKDRIFARLNLHADELDTYERLYATLAEHVIAPDLIVYLAADTPVLMQRIAVRDRPYERGMSVEYIERLRHAYEQFFTHYTEVPVLVINTNDLDYVRHPDQLEDVVQRIRSALGQGTHQPALPQFASRSVDTHDAISRSGATLERREIALAQERRRLADLQHWRRLLEANAESGGDPYYPFLCLQAHAGELANRLTHVRTLARTLCARYGNDEEALREAIGRLKLEMQLQLADCLLDILWLANNLDIDLESAVLQRMRELHGQGDMSEGGM